MRHAAPEVVDRGQYEETVTPWDREGWRDAALGWVDGGLAARGLRAAGPWRVRLRPWSVLVRVAVAGGEPVWFKANPPGSAFEGPLTAVLARRVPGRVLEPLAVDPARGWSLLPDGGPLFRDVLGRRDPGPGGWEDLLRQYASTQHALVPHTAELELLGVPPARTAALPDVFDRAVAENAELSPEDRAGFAALRPRLAEWCAGLAASGVPDTLDHADLHDGQVLCPAPGRFTFFDWGDAVVSHPFCSFLVPARSVRERYGPDALPRLRDAYLEPWTAPGRTPADLRHALALATRLGALSRALSWTRLFPADVPLPTAPAESARWLRRLLDAPEP